MNKYVFYCKACMKMTEILESERAKYKYLVCKDCEKLLESENRKVKTAKLDELKENPLAQRIAKGEKE